MSEDVETGRLVPYLVEMFRVQAWIGMGKVASPVSGKVERNLQVAKAMIDLLAELEERTEGHRSPEETKILQGTLTELRLNYLDELKKPEETPSSREENRASDTPREETETPAGTEEKQGAPAPETNSAEESKDAE